MAETAPAPHHASPIIINGQEYSIDVHLVNEKFSLQIPQPAIASLSIEDSIFSTFPSGRIIMKNTEDIIENYTRDVLNEQGHKSSTSFSFDANGRDIIMVEIMPISTDIEGWEEGFPEVKWKLLYVFAVIGESSQHTKDNAVKFKIFDLIDVREQLLNETVNSWSTNQALIEEIDHHMNLSQKSNEDRKVGTGAAIKNFLKFSLTDVEPAFSDDWDKGKTKVFYSSPGTSTAMGTLLQLLDSHVSEQNSDNCLLKLERDDKFSLRSYESYFKSCLIKGEENNLPGPYLMDAFSVPSQGGPNSNTSSLIQEIGESYTVSAKDQNRHLSKFSYELPEGIEWSDYDGMGGYSFVNFSIQDSINEITSLPVHHTSIQHKQFNIDNKDTHITNAKKKFHEMYTSNFHGANGKPKTIFPENKRKQENRLVNNIFSLQKAPEGRQKVGRNTLFNKVIAFAPSLAFTAPGSTHRKSGRFISIFGEPDSDTKFQNILQGEWFVTSVFHHFSPGKYENVMTGVKFYSFK